MKFVIYIDKIKVDKLMVKEAAAKSLMWRWRCCHLLFSYTVIFMQAWLVTSFLNTTNGMLIPMNMRWNERWINKCMYECMYGWLHKGFPEYHDVQLKKRDKERKTFLVIIQIHKTVSSFRTANHFTSHSLRINKIKKMHEGRMWDQLYASRANNHFHCVYVWRMSGKIQSHDYNMELVYLSDLLFIGSLDLFIYFFSKIT